MALLFAHVLFLTAIVAIGIVPADGRSSYQCSASQCQLEHVCREGSQWVFVDPQQEDATVLELPISISGVPKHTTLQLKIRPSPPANVTYIDGTALYFSAFLPDNVMHHLHDDVVPTFDTLKTYQLQNPLSPVQWLIVDNLREDDDFWWTPLLDRFHVNLHAFNEDDAVTCWNRVVFGLSTSSLFYDYGFHYPQSYRSDISESTVNIWHDFVKLYNGFWLKTPPKPALNNRKSAVIFVRESNRLMLNMGDLMQLLAVGYGMTVRTVSLERHNLIDIVDLVRSSNVMIGMHGSLLVLSAFAPPSTLLIEVFPYKIDPEMITPFRTLAALRGLQYVAVRTRSADQSVSHAEYPPELGGIRHLSIDQQRHVEDVGSDDPIPSFICCHNPSWLFRAYQDTFVDLDEIKSAVKTSCL